jgi:hypothetical protein
MGISTIPEVLKLWGVPPGGVVNPQWGRELFV